MRFGTEGRINSGGKVIRKLSPFYSANEEEVMKIW